MKWDEIQAMKAFIQTWEKDHEETAKIAEFADGLLSCECEEIVFILQGKHGAQCVSPKLPLSEFGATIGAILMTMIEIRGKALAVAKPFPPGK